jgi:hypothetical protein
VTFITYIHLNTSNIYQKKSQFASSFRYIPVEVSQGYLLPGVHSFRITVLKPPNSSASFGLVTSAQANGIIYEGCSVGVGLETESEVKFNLPAKTGKTDKKKTYFPLWNLFVCHILLSTFNINIILLFVN